MPARIRCQVLEVPAQDDWLSGRRGGARELLPWADPYIASLMRRLDGRYNRDEETDESHPFAWDEEPAGAAAFDDGWQEDAFMPRPVESLRFHSYPPVYGGFPLLEDE
jgi:hypothetical protein